METLMRSDLSIAFLAKWARTGDYGKKVGNGSSQCETCNSGFDVASSASITKHDCSSIQLNTYIWCTWIETFSRFLEISWSGSISAVLVHLD